MANKINRFLTTVKRSGAGKDKDRKLSIIILNSTPGYRMKSYGPKCLLKINNNISILEYQISILKNVYPNSEIVVTVGFEADKIIKKQFKNIRFVENQLFDTTNIVEEIRLALNNIETEDVLIVYGDVIFNTHAIEGLTKENTSCTVQSNKISEEDVGLTIVDNKLSIMSYGITPKWGYIVYLTGYELLLFKNLCSNKENNRLYPFELINIILERQQAKIGCINPPHSEIIKIESIKDIKSENSNI